MTERTQLNLVTTLHEYGAGAFKHADSDGKYVVVGTSRKILLFSLATSMCDVVISCGLINSVLLHYPYCMSVGTGCGGGVWDLTTGLLVKTFGDKKYWELHSNGRFLIASEMNFRLRKFETVAGRFPSLSVTMFDLKDLTTIKTEEDIYASDLNPDAVWNKQFYIPKHQSALRGTEYCCSAINMTALLASQNDMIFVYDFASNYKPANQDFVQGAALVKGKIKQPKPVGKRSCTPASRHRQTNEDWGRDWVSTLGHPG